MSDTKCHVITDCQGTPHYAYSSSEATCAGGAGATVGADAEAPHVACPEGYIWGGLNCIVDEGAQSDCSEGYFWSGAECVADGEACADGYYDNAGVCTPCPPLTSPAVVVVPGSIVFFGNNPFPGPTTLTIYVSRNGQPPTTDVSIMPGAGNFNIPLSSAGWAAGDEFCGWYACQPQAGSPYESCGVETSLAQCVIVHVL